MKIVKLIGGLGNQMFQYALYLMLKKTYEDELVLVDKTLFNSYGLHNGYELDRVFKEIEIEYASEKQIRTLTRYYRSFTLQRIARHLLPPQKNECIELKDFIFQNDVYRQGDCYYEGYWQNYNYFESIHELILDSFSFDLSDLSDLNKEVIRRISSSSNAVSIHIRRGDYVKHKTFGGICELDYYKKSISYIMDLNPNSQFYLFSNDMSWCIGYIVPLLGSNEVFIVDWNTGENSYVDMLLMSQCKCNIIANSSFSWWASFLNQHKNKKIISPIRWTNKDVARSIQLDDWILIE